MSVIVWMVLGRKGFSLWVKLASSRERASGIVAEFMELGYLSVVVEEEVET